MTQPLETIHHSGPPPIERIHEMVGLFIGSGYREVLEADRQHLLAEIERLEGEVKELKSGIEKIRRRMGPAYDDTIL